MLTMHALPRLIAQLGTDEPIEMWRATEREPVLSPRTLQALVDQLGAKWHLVLLEAIPDGQAIGRHASVKSARGRGRPFKDHPAADDSDLSVEDLREYALPPPPGRTAYADTQPKVKTASSPLGTLKVKTVHAPNIPPRRVEKNYL